MNDLLIRFLELPDSVLDGAFGVLGAIIGAILSYAIWRTRQRKLVVIGLVVGLFVLFVACGRFGVAELRERHMGGLLASGMKQQRLFAAIVAAHPEADVELREAADKAVVAPTPEQQAAQIRRLGATFMLKYLKRHMPTAPAEAVVKLAQHNLATMKLLADRPAVCVGYFSGGGQVTQDDIPAGSIVRESELRAEIIESSIRQPVPAEPPLDDATLVALIGDVYRETGHDPANFSRLSSPEPLPLAERCALMTEFSDVLATAEPAKSARIMKSSFSRL